MACPCFQPERPAPWPAPKPRLRPPLGEFFEGRCAAEPDRPATPTGPRQRECCNWGYARGACERLPAGAPDAIRFALVDEEPGRLTVAYAVERDHRPAEVGREAFARAGLEPRPPAPGETLARTQCRAYAAAFVRALEGNGVDGPRGV